MNIFIQNYSIRRWISAGIRLLPLLLLMGVVYAQFTSKTLVCSGTIVDSETKQPLSQAIVKIIHPHSGCIKVLHSLEDGNFEYFSKERIQHFELHISKDGYLPKSIHLCDDSPLKQLRIIALRKATIAIHH